jgi:hypothetical protein
MIDLYNSILDTYASRFEELKPKAQFHLASRLHLWCREPKAEEWIELLRPKISAGGNPKQSVTNLLKVTPAPLNVSGKFRQNYFSRFPELRMQERVLFRLLFLKSVYGFDTSAVFYEFFDAAEAKRQHDELLADADALRTLSSFGINYLYLLDRFIEGDESSLPVGQLLEIGRSYNSSDDLQRHLQCYYYTHAIIAESLFYARSISGTNKDLYMQMLLETEKLVANNFEQTTLDTKLEYLVCCRLLGQTSPLEEAIMDEVKNSVGPEGYIVDARLNTRRADSLHNAKHRNVLFLLTQKPFQPVMS